MEVTIQLRFRANRFNFSRDVSIIIIKFRSEEFRTKLEFTAEINTVLVKVSLAYLLDRTSY